MHFVYNTAFKSKNKVEVTKVTLQKLNNEGPEGGGGGVTTNSTHTFVSLRSPTSKLSIVIVTRSPRSPRNTYWQLVTEGYTPG